MRLQLHCLQVVVAERGPKEVELESGYVPLRGEEVIRLGQPVRQSKKRALRSVLPGLS